MYDDLTHKFSLDFGDGVTVTAVIDVKKLRESKGKLQFCVVEWDGKRKESHKPLYKQWMIDVQQKAADLLPGKIMWMFEKEVYAFEPGKVAQKRI